MPGPFDQNLFFAPVGDLRKGFGLDEGVKFVLVVPLRQNQKRRLVAGVAVEPGIHVAFSRFEGFQNGGKGALKHFFFARLNLVVHSDCDHGRVYKRDSSIRQPRVGSG
jgi:hypothetical protein